MPLDDKRIYVTREYDQFKFLKENRRLNPRNYAKLVTSMKEEQLVIPILCNEKMEIIDGQHRFSVCKELNLPVHFYIQKGYGIEQVKRANIVGSNWTSEDFLNMHIEDGNDNYIDFKGLIQRYAMSISDLLKVFAIVQGTNQKLIVKFFEEGSFTTEGMTEVIEFLHSLEDFNFFKNFKTRQFVGAFIKLYFHPDYDHKKMKERLKTRKSYIVNKSTIDEYLTILTKDIYSFGPVKKPLFYDNDTKRFYTK